ncbi:MAG: prepilin-type N-terminal cleavage/methylation domain-containing protein [Acidobacteriota bacterium]
MRGHYGFSLLELIVAFTVLAIIAAIAVPNLNKLLISYKTRIAAEALASQLNQARQAAINFGRRTNPLTVYLYPAAGDKGVGVWFDRNNKDITAPTSAPSNETIFLPQAIAIGNSVTASPQCATSGPLDIVQFDSRGELRLGYPVQSCLQTNPPSITQPINIYVEYLRNSNRLSSYVVGVSQRGSVSVIGLR